MGDEALASFCYVHCGSRRNSAVNDCEFWLKLFNVANGYVCKVLLVTAWQANVHCVYSVWNIFSALTQLLHFCLIQIQAVNSKTLFLIIYQYKKGVSDFA